MYSDLAPWSVDSHCCAALRDSFDGRVLRAQKRLGRRYRFGRGKPSHDEGGHDWDSTQGGANRFATLFMYLRDVEDGGHTIFPASPRGMELWGNHSLEKHTGQLAFDPAAPATPWTTR